MNQEIANICYDKLINQNEYCLNVVDYLVSLNITEKEIIEIFLSIGFLTEDEIKDMLIFQYGLDYDTIMSINVLN